VSPATDCPCCFGRGQITGPDSVAFRGDPRDPFNAIVRLCDECEGTGVVTAVRAAGIMAQAMDKALAVIDRGMPDLAQRATERAERQMQALGISLDPLSETTANRCSYAVTAGGCPAFCRCPECPEGRPAQ
jgi:hypothetical protein